MKLDIAKLRASGDGEVIFADESARALLSDRLNELDKPASRNGWRQIKQNASRTVYKQQLDGREVYLKHFHSKAIGYRLAKLLGSSDAKTEMRFSRYLSDRGVQTAPALAACCNGAREWLVTEAIQPAQVGHLWHQDMLRQGPRGHIEIRKAIVNLAETIARMHSVGVIHCDLHAGNIMVRATESGPQCVLMDLHRMKKWPWLTRRARAINLAKLLHDRRDWTTRSQRVLFLKRYLAASGESGPLRGWVLTIEQFARRHRRKLYAQRDRRVFGNNRYFSRIRLANSWSGHVVLASKRRTPGSTAAEIDFKASQWAKALAQPEHLLIGRIVKTIKNTRSGQIVRRKLTVGQHELDVFIKRPRRKKTWKVLLDCLRPARPIRAFRLGHALLTRRIDTVLPLAALERRIGPFLLDSILITEAHDAQQLNDFLNKRMAEAGGDAEPLKHSRRRPADEALRRMGQMVQRLHDNNYRHRDLKSANMLVQWSPETGPVILLVDMDGLRHLPWLTTRQRFQNLMRLNVSLLRCQAINRAGQLRMLMGYLKRTHVSEGHFKPYWRMLETWSERKLRRQIRSRRKKQRAVRR